MRILVIGASGFVGRPLAGACPFWIRWNMKTILTLLLVLLALAACAACSGGDPADAVPAPPTTESTPVPLEAEETGWRTEIMAVLPVTAADSGVWYSNPALALELAGAEEARKPTEWESFTPEQQQAYQDASAGLRDSAIRFSMKQAYPDWDETFGFGAWDVSAMAETGATMWQGFQTHVLIGEFDPAIVNRKLLDLGFAERNHLGVGYLTLPEGVRPELDWLRQITLNSEMRNVLVEEQRLITAPTEEKMQEVLAARAGEIPSLVDHAAFGDLASLAPDPLIAVILDREVVLESEKLSVGDLPDQPEEWGETGNWEAMSAVFSRPSLDLGRTAYLLWYAELAEAEEGAAELSVRFNTPKPSSLDAMFYLAEFCAGSWQIEALNTSNGSVVEVACQSKDVGDLGPMTDSALINGWLAFMIE